MNSAESNKPKKLLTLVQAAEKLGVNVDTLLEWNEHHILKPTITAKGSIGYPTEQIEQFLKAKNAVNTDPQPAYGATSEANTNAINSTPEPTAPLTTEAPAAPQTTDPASEAITDALSSQPAQEAVVVPANEPQSEPVATPPTQSKHTGLYHQFIAWIGEGFYSDKDVKDHITSQVKESLSFNFSKPSLPPLPSFKRSPKMSMGFAVGVILLFGLYLFTQQYKINFWIQDYQKSDDRQAASNEKSVLAEQTSKLKIQGSVVFRLPVVFKEKVVAEKDVQIGRNLAVSGTGVFKGNLTAPNIVYSIVAGDNVTVSGDLQNPTISVEVPETVSTFQGEIGDIELEAGDGISIDGLTISSIDDLAMVTGRGLCDGCVTDVAVADNLTIDSGGNVAAGAITGLLTTTVGGTGISSYNTGDMLYASGSNTLEALPIGTQNGQILQVLNGIPAWSSLSLDAPGSDNLTSGANLIGVYDNLVNTSSNNLQQVLSDIDAAITSAGVSPFTIVTNGLNPDIIRPTNVTHDFALGGTGQSDSSLFFDESAGNLFLGTNNTGSGGLDGTLTFFSSGNGITDPSISASPSGDLLIPNGNVGIGAVPDGQFRLVVGGHIGPSADSVYDLGSATNRFRNLYLSGTTTADGDITIVNADPSLRFEDNGPVSDDDYAIFTNNSVFTIQNESQGRNDLIINAAGDFALAGGVSSTGCTITNSNGNLSCTGSITGSNNGTIGYWSRDNTNSTIYSNATDDILIGAPASASAKFGFLNVAGGTPTASVAANNGANAAFLTGAGNLGTTNAQTLALGGTSTGNIVIDSGSGAIFLSDPTTLSSSLTVIGTSDLQGDISDSLGNVTIADSLDITGSTLTFNNAAALITTGINQNLTLTPNGSGELTLTSDFDSGVNIGADTNTSAPLSISGGIGSNASLIVNNTNSGDLIAASASGISRFRVTNTGELQLGDNNSTFFGTLDLATLTQDRSYTLPNENGTFCIQASVSCGFAIGSNYWQLNANMLSPSNSTYDFAIGGTATSAANFAIIGVANNTPVATLSALSNNNGLVLDAANSSLQSLLNNTLRIGGNTTGDILLSGRGGQNNAIIFQNYGQGILHADSTGRLTSSALNLSGGITEITGILPVINGGSPFDQGNGAIFERNITQDLLLGSIATTSARFAFINVNSGTPTASIAAGTTNNNTFLTGAGNLGTTNSQTLTLGGLSTGDIVLNGRNAANGIIFQNYGAGILRSDSTGRLTSSVVNLAGGLDVTGVLPVVNGGSPFEEGNGAIYERLITQDFLIGGTSTASAKFAITNVAGGTPTASLSGTNNNALILTATGTLSTTNAQALRIGDGATGDVILSGRNGQPDGVILSGYGAGALQSDSTGRVTSGTLPASYGGTGFNTYNLGELLVGNGSNALSKLIPGSDGSILSLVAGSPAWISNASVNFWQRNLGALAPTNITDDLLLGGTATNTARFAFTNNTGPGIPIASISANSGNNNTFLTGTGVLGTTNAQTLNIGNDTTGNVVIDAGSGLITLVDNTGITGNLDVSGTLTSGTADAFQVDVNGNVTSTGTTGITLSGVGAGLTFSAATGTNIIGNSGGGTLQINAFTLGGTLTAAGQTITNVGTLDFGTDNLALTGTTISTSGNNNNLTLTPNGSGNTILSSDFNSGVFIGSAANTPAPLSVSGGIGSNASLIVNNTNSGDLIAASASGTTLFRVTNTGEVVLGDNTSSFFGTVDLATLTQNRTFTLPNENGTFCIQASASCGFAIGTNYWQSVNPGTIAPYNTTVDVLFGGTATTSADFAFINVASGVPTASISAGSGNSNTFLTGAGNLGTTNAQTLTVGGLSTGNIVIDSGSGLITLADSTAVNGNLSVSGNTTLGDAGSDLVTINAGVLSLVNASTLNLADAQISALNIEGGLLNFDTLNGFIGIGTLTPTAELDVDGAASIAGSLTFRQGPGVIQTSQLSPLTIGGNTTGQIILSPTGLNRIGIGFSGTPLGALDLRSSLATLPIASLSGSTTFAGLVVDNSGSGDIFTASRAGATRFTINSSGSIQLTGGSGFLQTLTSNAAGEKTYILPDFGGTSASLCLTTGNCAGAGGGVTTTGGTNNYVTKFSGGQTVVNSNIFDDGTAVGIGTATPIGFFNLNGARAGQALTVLNYTGSGQNLLTASVSGTTVFNLSDTGIIQFGGGTSVLNTITSAATTPRTYNFPDFNGDICLTVGNCAGAGGGIVGSGTTNRSARFAGTGSIENGSINDLYASGVVVTIASSSAVGIGTSAPLASLDVRSSNVNIPVASFSGATTVSTLVLDNSGSGDLFTASTSGITRFVLQNTGNLLFYGNQSAPITITSAATAPRTLTLPNETGTVCIQTSVNCGFAIGTNYWQLNAGLLSPSNSTFDFGIGGTSTSSALFAVTGVANGTPVATLSAATNSNGLAFDAVNSTIQSLRNNTLTLGGNTTGNVVVNAGSGLISLLDATMIDGSLTVTGVISDSDTNLILDDIVDIGSVANGINIDIAGLISDNDANVVIGDIVDLGSAAQGINITTTGLISDNDANVVIGDIVDLGSAAQGINITTTGVISDSDGNISLNDTTDITGNLSVTGTTQFGGITYTWPGSQSPDYILATNGSGTLSWTNLATSPGNFWRQLNGALYPANSTVDLLVGGTSTSSADFAFINTTGAGVPTASISAGSGNNRTFLTGAGNLGTTNAQTLTIGGLSTGNIVIDSGVNVTRFNDATINLSALTPLRAVFLDASSNLTTTAPSLSLLDTLSDETGTGVAVFGTSPSITTSILTGSSNFDVFNTNATAINAFGAATTLNIGANTGTLSLQNPTINVGGGSAATIQTVSDDNLTLSAQGLGNITLTSDFNSGVNIGSDTNTPAPLSISGGIGSNASLIVNNTNSGDLIAASASGISRFRVTNTGEVVLGDNTSTFFGTVDTTTLTANQTYTLPNATGTFCLQNSASCGFAFGTNYWQSVNSGTIAPYNTTVDLLVGGTSTASADFAITGIAGGTPVATLSAATNGNGLVLDAFNSSLQSLRNNTLRLGGDTTGDIVLSGRNGQSNAILLEGYGAGALQTNAFGRITSDVLPEIYGGTGLNTYQAGDLIYASGIDTLANLVIGSDDSVLSISGGMPVWVSNASVNFWQRNFGSIAPLNVSDDLLLGSTATSSARIGFINIAEGSPTASLSGGLTGGLYINASGTIATTAEQSLSIGDVSTGDIRLTVGAGNNLRINGTAGATIGISSCVTSINGIVTGFGTCQEGGEPWNIANGTIYVANTTLDMLVGGTSSSSAKFAVLNVNPGSGTPTASISAGSGNNNAFLTGAGNLGTTNMQTLTLGGATTGDIVLNGRNASGNGIILQNYGTGILHSDSFGRLTSSLVNLTGAVDVTGICLL